MSGRQRSLLETHRPTDPPLACEKDGHLLLQPRRAGKTGTIRLTCGWCRTEYTARRERDYTITNVTER